MAYNITRFHVKALDNLCIPLAALFQSERSDWHPRKVVHDHGEVSFQVMESCLKGTIQDDILHVLDFECVDEGSGTAMQVIFEPAFQASTGLLRATCVYEGGDSIYSLEVLDGTVTWTQIEL